MKTVRLKTLVSLLLTLYIVLPAQTAVGEERRTLSLAMTGSLYALSPIEIPQGGLISSSDFFLVIFNHGDEPVKVAVEYEAPPGITLIFDPQEAAEGVVLEPGSHVKVKVAIAVTDDVLPGTYTVYVKAVPKLERKENVVVIGAGLAQTIQVIVRGASASITVKALDPGGAIAENALIKLYRIVRNRMVSIMDSYGALKAKVVPGNYTVKVYLAGEEVASKNIVVRAGEHREVELTLKIAYFELFSLEPILQEDKLVGFHVKAIIKNLYRPLTDASIVLVVERGGERVLEYYVMKSSTLPRGRNEFSFDYILRGSLEPGNYTVYMELYAFNGKLIAVSSKASIFIPEPSSCIPFCAAAALLAAAVTVMLRRRRGEERG